MLRSLISFYDAQGGCTTCTIENANATPSQLLASRLDNEQNCAVTQLKIRDLWFRMTPQCFDKDQHFPHDLMNPVLTLLSISC